MKARVLRGSAGLIILLGWSLSACTVKMQRDGLFSRRSLRSSTAVKLASKNVSGVTYGTFHLSFSGADASEVKLLFRDTHTGQTVFSSRVLPSGEVYLPGLAGLYTTELTKENGTVSYGQATVTDPITSWSSVQTFTPSVAFGHYRVWPDYTRAFGDYDGDGHLDFAYAEGNDGSGASVNPGIYLYRWDSGTSGFVFDARIESTVPKIKGMRFVDLNGDGALDLVYAFSDDTTYSAGICYLLNTDGTFGASTCLMDSGTSVSNQTEFTQIDVADVNHDGKPDVVAVGSVQSNGTINQVRLVYYRNTGSGLVVDADLTDPAVMHFSHVKIADMNDDGKLDFVALEGENNPAAQIYIFPQADDGTFSTASATRVPASGTGLFSLGYLNADTKPDIIVTAQGNGTGKYLESNADDDTFTSHSISAPTELFSGLSCVTDLNLDGTPEVYFAPKNRLLYNNKDGIYFEQVSGFSSGISLNSSNTIVGATSNMSWAESNFDLVDLNGDRKLDLLYFSAYSGGTFEVIQGN